jgi:hypothetical protein
MPSRATATWNWNGGQFQAPYGSIGGAGFNPNQAGLSSAGGLPAPIAGSWQASNQAVQRRQLGQNPVTGAPGYNYAPEATPSYGSYGSYGSSPGAGVATRGGALNPATPQGQQGLDPNNIGYGDIISAYDNLISGLGNQGQGAINAIDRQYAKARGSNTQNLISRGFYGQYGNQPTEELGRYGTVAASLGRGLALDQSQATANVHEQVAGQQAQYQLERAKTLAQLQSGQISREEANIRAAESARRFDAQMALSRDRLAQQDDLARRNVNVGGVGGYGNSGGGYGGGGGGRASNPLDPFGNFARGNDVLANNRFGGDSTSNPYGYGSYGGYGRYGLSGGGQPNFGQTLSEDDILNGYIYGDWMTG